MKKFAIISLGCSKNLVDSEVFAYITETAGYTLTEETIEAEVIIVNTCGFILDAKEESISTILEAADLKKSGKCRKLIVTGCLVKRYYDDIKNSFPEIDTVIQLKDFNAFKKIFEISSAENRKLLTLPHFGYLRVSDGCNNHCSYCAIPAIRGHLKSVPIENLVSSTEALVANGVREIILTAQDTAQYGVDIYGEQKLPELLQKLHAIKNLEWIRILYLHPAHISSELIDSMAELPKICKYFEIPIQHISNEILGSMNRKVTKERIMQIISEIRSKMPDAVVRTTLITGYPGETEERYIELKDFVKELKFERLGAFAYSKEEDTPAYDLELQVSEEIAEQRKDELMQIQQNISEEFLAGLVGKKIQVIIDTKSKEEEFVFEGRSYFDSPEIDGMVLITEGKANIGEIVNVEIIDAWEYDLIGKIV
ncbi:MAG: 30S ribosomal protein S12 methylthiotransferase RimO [Candidatus Cloacimonetes bacterium]|nr:30S ribosomal protein S12 methylthiotransferase RimO [Candidatus Cloacimonadota bacterium]MBT5419307.1 30S ribosomal protein S12 methylthiotransferase RimO [Candidatus Cloacimonadota bacterium]